MKPKTFLIESLIGLGALLLIVSALGYYILNEPARIVNAQDNVIVVQLDDAMTLYAENCSVCHGLNGEGIGATPPLDSAALRTMPYDDIYKTIARGRYQTAMPAWAIEDGGPLSDYQIDELVTLIIYGDWVETGNRTVNLGYAPLIPFTTEPDPVLLAEVGNLPDGATLQTAVQLFAANCVACHGADGLGTAIAPALNDPLVREKTADDITRIITYGNTGTLMAGWSNTLSADEINALASLVARWDEVPLGIIPSPDVPIPVTEESIALGGQLFAANCSRCHGPEGQGTPRAPSLNVKSFLTDTSDQAIQQIVTLGVPGTAMPSWGDRMTDADIQAIVGFIRQWEPAAPEVAILTRPGGGGPPWTRSTTTNNFGLLPSTNTTTTTTTGPGHQVTAQPVTQSVLDWRILVLLGVVLSMAFTLIFAGLESLRQRSPKVE
jgi:mono/diheme cytochrome c family protein